MNSKEFYLRTLPIILMFLVIIARMPLFSQEKWEKLKWNDFIYPKTFLSKKIRYFISFISFLISLICLFSSIYLYKNIDWCEFPTGSGDFSTKPETNWILSLLYFLSYSLISISYFIISFSMIFNIGWRLMTFYIFSISPISHNILLLIIYLLIFS